MDSDCCSCDQTYLEILHRRKLLSLAAVALCLYQERRKQSQKKKRCWSRLWLQRRCLERGVLSMLFNELSPEDPKSFKNYTRIHELILEELLTDVTAFIEKQDTVMRQAIPARDRLAVTLRYLASGSTYVDLSYATRIAHNTLAKMIPETLRAIVRVLDKKVIKCPSSVKEWEAEAGRFHAQWQYPNCIGAIDGKHISFRPARKEGSRFRNYKGYDSIILLALVNANYEFLYVDIGRNGRRHDSTAYRASTLCKHLQSAKLNIPPPKPLPGETEPMPFVIVADDAFSLETYMMKPYPGRGINDQKRIFNYRLSRARRVVENAFGILSNRFRILLTTIPLSADKVELITYACVLLHNFLLQKDALGFIPVDCQEGRGVSTLTSVSRQGGSRCKDSAIDIRDKFCS